MLIVRLVALEVGGVGAGICRCRCGLGRGLERKGGRSECSRRMREAREGPEGRMLDIWSGIGGRIGIMMGCWGERRALRSGLGLEVPLRVLDCGMNGLTEDKDR